MYQPELQSRLGLRLGLQRQADRNTREIAGLARVLRVFSKWTLEIEAEYGQTLDEA